MSDLYRVNLADVFIESLVKDGTLVPVEDERLSRAEWEATLKAVVTVNADDSNDFGWMEYVKGPYPIETTATMLPTGRYGLVKLDAAVGEKTWCEMCWAAPTGSAHRCELPDECVCPDGLCAAETEAPKDAAVGEETP